MKQSTNKLSFSWAEDEQATKYSIKVYQNNLHINTLESVNNYIDINNLREGDFVYCCIHKYVGNVLYREFVTTETQRVAITNFYEKGKPFVIKNVRIDSTELHSSQNPFCDFKYFYNKHEFNVSIDLLSPNHNKLHSKNINDPYFKSCKYRIGEIHNIDEIPFDTSNSLKFDIQNVPEYQDPILQIDIEDYFGNIVTTHIELIKDVARIKNCKIIKHKNETEIECITDTELSSLDYFIYDNIDCSGDYLCKESIEYFNRFFIPYYSDENKFLKIIPRNGLGTGLEYIHPSSVGRVNLAKYQPKHTNTLISDNAILPISYGQFIINFNSNCEEDCFYTLSIDKDINTKFTNSSLLTGAFDMHSKPVNFNCFDYIESGNGRATQDFHVSINLVNKHTNLVEDSIYKFKEVNMPKIISTQLNFDYKQGITSLNVQPFPEVPHPKVDLIVENFEGSGQSVSYLSAPITTNNYDIDTTVLLVNSNDHTKVYDRVNIKDKAIEPSITVSPLTSDVDGYNFFQIFNNCPVDNLISINAYGKLSYSSSQSSPKEFADSYNFKDYEQHFLKKTNFGRSFYNEITGYHPNKTYTYKQNGDDFIYESGMHAVYAFLPYNGYTTGEFTGPIQQSIYHKNPSNHHLEMMELQKEIEILKSQIIK